MLTNGGQDWEQKVNNMTGTTIKKIATRIGLSLVATDESGIFYKPNIGFSGWIDITHNLPPGFIYDIAINPVTQSIFVSHQDGTFRLVLNGTQWENLGYMSHSMFFKSTGLGFWGYGNSVRLSDDDGTTSNNFYVGDIPDVRQFGLPNPDQSDKMFLAATDEFGNQGDGVWESSSPYNTWTRDGLAGLPVTSLESIDLGDSLSGCLGHLAAGTNNGKFFMRDDNGQYTEHSEGLVPTFHIKSIASLNIPNSVFPIIEISHGNLSSFNPTTCMTEESLVIPQDVLVECINGEYLANFKSKLKKGNEEAYLYYGTIGCGVLRRDLLTDVENISSDIPKDFFLGQNYPNPFNPSTTIQFSIPEQSLVKLEVFNTLGEKVSTLVSEVMNAGSYKYDWNAKGLSSGVYFYRLSTENFNQTKKLLLMK